MLKEGYWEQARALSDGYMRKLDKLDRETIQLVSARYMELTASMNKQIEQLSHLKNLTPDQLRQLSVYQEFVRTLNERMVSFGLYNERLVSTSQTVHIQLGLEMSQKTLSLISVSFQKLNTGALDWIVGNSLRGGRLYGLLSKDYPTTVDNITKVLIESVAIGRNPRATARLLKDEMNGNLARALRIARTEQIMAYREASRQQMIQSGLVSTYERIEQPDCCDYCKERNGKRYPLDEPFETHPHCRGTLIPAPDF
jgi:SPP1 gp7 family putative phage head morphogenesis protein